MDVIIDSILAYHDEDLTFQREVCMLYSRKTGVIDVSTTNTAGSVGFNFDKAHERIVQQGMKPDVLYMIHTHPHGFYRMSSIDKNMVHSWVIAFGVPIMFLIVCDDKIIYNLCFKDSRTKKIKQFELFCVSEKYNHIPACSLLVDLMYGMSKMENDLSEGFTNTVCSLLNNSGFDLSCIAHNDLINHVVDVNDMMVEQEDIVKTICSNPQLYTDDKITLVNSIQ